MNTSPLSLGSSGSIAAHAPHSSVEKAPEAGSGIGGFARLVTQFLNDAGAHQAHAEQAVTNLAAGRADNVHSVMLSMAKADVSFHLLLEIRNRLSDAYQEIMRMQV